MQFRHSFLLVIFFFGILFAFTPAAAFSNSDSSSVYKERSFNNEKIEDFKKSRDFKYAEPPKFDPLKRSLLARLAYWMGLLFSKVPRGVWRMLPYLLMVAAAALVIFYIRKSTLTGALGGKIAQASAGDVLEENIHALDFEKAIREAIAGKQFRLAIRLYFLMTLKFLDDQKLLHHSREKTNREYLQELSDTIVKEDFRWLSKSFEFVWYGNINPEQPLFEQIQLRYENFFKRASGQAPQ